MVILNVWVEYIVQDLNDKQGNKMNNKNTTLSEQFQNIIEKSQKEVKS
jgi:hypothetical protein